MFSAAVLSAFLVAMAAPWIHRAAGRWSGWALALFPASLAVWFTGFAGEVAAGRSFRDQADWLPSLGISFSFFLDGLSLLFALLICGIGALVLVYAGGYLAGHRHLGRFYCFLLFFLASMLGLVLADNAITLFAFWELTSISSYLLIGFEHEREAARKAALQALLVTGAGGLAMLAGLLLLGQAGGSLEISELLSRREVIQAHPLYVPIVLLILAGAFTKSAQFPFHFWLPAAMEAPAPVSAYLHSATMVKAGIYLLARLSPALGGTEVWSDLVMGAGAVTMLVGAWLAFHQHDLKLILAHSTVSVLGFLTLLVGIGTPGAMEAAMVYLLAHAFYKGALFLVAGAVDHETGTRDIDRLGGLRRAMPVTATAAVLAALSMAGLPPLFGFLGKEAAYESLLESAPGGGIWMTVAVVSSMLLLAVAGLVGWRPFFGRSNSTPKHPHEAPPSLWLGPVVLGGLGMLSGLAPGTIGWLASSAASAAWGQTLHVELALFHGWTPALLLSGVTVAGGLGLYAIRRPARRLASFFAPVSEWGPRRWYELGILGLNGLAKVQTRFFQSGYLRYYLLTIVATTLGLSVFTIVREGGPYWSSPRMALAPYEAALVAMILLAALAAVRARSRLAAVAALGVVGSSVALVFVLYGAPDLAMTQFLVETLTVLLLVLVLYHLPRFATLSSRRARIRDLLVALPAGALMSLLVLAAPSVPHGPAVSGYFSDKSVELAHGRNIVNVILVDFRGLDTLGEITVLAVAAIGVYALLKLRVHKGDHS